jgi:tyrosyl-tRNA synthetase
MTDHPEIRIEAGTINVPTLLTDNSLSMSRSEARRVVMQGGFSVNGEPVRDMDVDATTLDGATIKVGRKKFAKIVIDNDGTVRKEDNDG